MKQKKNHNHELKTLKKKQGESIRTLTELPASKEIIVVDKHNYCLICYNDGYNEGIKEVKDMLNNYNRIIEENIKLRRRLRENVK